MARKSKTKYNLNFLKTNDIIHYSKAQKNSLINNLERYFELNFNSTPFYMNQFLGQKYLRNRQESKQHQMVIANFYQIKII